MPTSWTIKLRNQISFGLLIITVAEFRGLRFVIYYCHIPISTEYVSYYSLKLRPMTSIGRPLVPDPYEGVVPTSIDG